MIHFTVAAPKGIDSVFFSFIQRLALESGHICMDPPAEQLDEPEPGGWIERMKSSSQHHFVICYRYLPEYLMRLVESASTACLIAYPDGIARQEEQIFQYRLVNGGRRDLRRSIQAIHHAFDATIKLAEWITSENMNIPQIIPPAAAIRDYPLAACQRLGNFYCQAVVGVVKSCSERFCEEALPHLKSVYLIDPHIRKELKQQLTLENSTPARLKAIIALFNDLACSQKKYWILSRR